jgi:hypothetical protein
VWSGVGLLIFSSLPPGLIHTTNTHTHTRTCTQNNNNNNNNNKNQSKAAALRLLHRLGARCDDNTRLQRLVPYMLSMLDDASVYVRVRTWEWFVRLC